MHARVSTFLGSAADVDSGVAYLRDNIVPAAQKLEGFQGAMLLLDRASGKSVTLTFWDTEDHLRASEQEANRLRQDAAARERQIIQSVERYEVAIDVRG